MKSSMQIHSFITPKLMARLSNSIEFSNPSSSRLSSKIVSLLSEDITEYLVYRCTHHAWTRETPAFLRHGRIHQTRLHLQRRGKPESAVPLHVIHKELPNGVKEYHQPKIKAYSDATRAVQHSAFAPGQLVNILKPSITGKIRNKYAPPRRIHQQIGPAKFRLYDGTARNAAKVTHTKFKPPNASRRGLWTKKYSQ